MNPVNPVCTMLAEHYKNMTDWVKWSMDELTDEEMKQAIAPGTNHGVWILGHLIVSDDDLCLYLGKGEKLFPDLFAVYGSDAKCLDPNSYPPASELKPLWKKVYERNAAMIAGMSDSELDEPHGQVKDLETDYFKTKRSVISNWILHQQYHAGQFGMLDAQIKRQREANKEKQHE